ncbi:hypothetical protein [Gabonibacter massiliensis]|uniref:hypothetical protein n=1 Tax=Gabonibacter massiliensis TaxID=1720195 RepID=UPI00073E4658|nr:hypothetical protein [Gabonibacter massiliensis]
MKKYILVYVVFAFLSCSEEKQKIVERYVFQEISKDLGDDYKDIVRDLKSYYAPEELSKSSEIIKSSPTRKFMSELEQYKLSALSYYKFDTKQFYDNPSEENLLKCMIPLNKLNIITERDGIAKARILIEKVHGVWVLNQLTPTYGKTISWLCDSLYKAGTKHCKIFVHGSTREFVTYEKKGKPLYFRVTGEPVSAERLCEYFVEQYKRAQEQLKYIEEHPELFGDPPPQNDKTH